MGSFTDSHAPKFVPSQNSTIAPMPSMRMYQNVHSVVVLELTTTGSSIQAKHDQEPAIPLLNIHRTEMFTYVPKDKDRNVHCSQSGDHSNARCQQDGYIVAFPHMGILCGKENEHFQPVQQCK